MSATTLSPFTVSVNGYLSAGWDFLLPLPEGAKFPPPKGYTGRSAAVPTEEDLAAWGERGGNIAIRLPETVIGIDVDNYSGKVGGRTISEVEEKAGMAFPPTWTSSRHEDLSAGRTMLYTIPAGTTLISGLKDVDVIQSGHRYLTAPPSIHPSGAAYYWTTPGGAKVEGTLVFPELDEIPELPAVLLSFFVKNEVSTENTEDLGDWDAGLGWLPGGLMCDCLKDKSDYYKRGLKTAETARHDFAVKAVTSMLFTAQKGHRGILPALENFRAAFVAEIHRDRGSIEMAIEEFANIVEWSSKTVASKFAGCSESSDPCLSSKNSKGMRSFTPKAKYKKPYRRY